MRKNSARPARSMTSSSWASRVDDRRGQRVVAPAGAGPAQLREVRERRLPVRHREAREAVLLEAEIDRARRRELDRGGDPLRPGARGPRLARRPGGSAASSAPDFRNDSPSGRRRSRQRLERPAVADRGQDVGQLAVLGPGVVDVVGDDDRQAELVGQRRRLGHEPVVVGQQVVRQLDEEAAAAGPVAAPEEPRVALRDGPGAGPIADPQAAGDLPVAAAGQGDEPLGVLGQERLAEARHALRPGHVRPRDEPAQAPPADRGPGEQDEMRPAAALADPAQVLLDRLAMAGQPGALGPRPDREALGHGRIARRCGRVGPAAAPSPRPRRGRDHAPVRVRDGRVEQLDLEPDDRVQARRPRPRRRSGPRRTGPAWSVTASPVSPSSTARSTRSSGARGAIEEREVRVAVELGVRDGCHGSLRS